VRCGRAATAPAQESPRCAINSESSPLPRRRVLAVSVHTNLDREAGATSTPRANTRLPSALRSAGAALRGSGVASPSPRFFAYALALYIAVVVGRIHESIPGLAALYPGKITGVLLLVACLAQRSKLRMGAALRTTAVRCLLLITALGVLSVPTSYWPKASLDFLTNQWPLVLLMAFCVVAGFGDQRTALIGIMSFTIAAGLGAMQLLLGAGMNEGGRVYIGVGASSTYDPNYSAAFFAMALPYAVMFATRSGKMRWIALPFIPCLAIAIIQTASRGGLVALVVVVATMVFFGNKKHRMKYLAAAVVGISAMTLVPHSQIAQRFSDVSNGTDYNFTARDGRMEVWGRGITMMENRPLTGVGIYAYEAADGVMAGSWMNAHNAFIQIGAELGVGGFVAFVIAIIAGYRAALRRRREESRPARREEQKERALGFALINAALCSLIAEITAALFLSMAYEAMTLFAIAVPCGLAMAAHRHTSSEDMRGRTRMRRRPSRATSPTPAAKA
jgi:O-antigen ligase